MTNENVILKLIITTVKRQNDELETLQKRVKIFQRKVKILQKRVETLNEQVETLQKRVEILETTTHRKNKL